jgi:hypothetical protein
MRKLFKRLLEIETYKRKELEMLMLNSLLLRRVMLKELPNVRSMKYNTNRTHSKEISRSLSSKRFRTL